MLIDTHCHLHDPEWFTPEQQAEFLVSAGKLGVEKLICIGTNDADSQVARDFAERHENAYWTYGIHPEFAGMTTVEQSSTGEKTFDLLGCDLLDRLVDGDYSSSGEPGGSAEDKRADPATAGVGDAAPEKSGRRQISPPAKLMAIGEIGLDYHYDDYDRDAQIHLFEQMLQLAHDAKLPVSLHIRSAFADAFAVLDNFPDISGVVHSFTGSKKELRQALERGFFIGVNGLATYSTLPTPPLDRILLETDAPFLTPTPFRGTINQPGYVRYVARYLAETMGVTEKEIKEQTTKNARQVFRI